MDLFRIKSVERSIAETDEPEHRLKKELSAWDLTVFGVGVMVGTGIFVLTGEQAFSNAGPAIVISFVLAGIACGLAALCYAEFASTVPVAGSAYTFSYATLGELIAWIIGWDLVLELALGAAVVARGWSAYLQSLFDLPTWLAGDEAIPDFGAIAIVLALTVVGVLGTKLSGRITSVLVIVKVAVVTFVIVAGLFFIKASNYTPFIPESQPRTGEGSTDAWTQSLFSFLSGAAPAQYGVFGLLAGASLVFFAFIGFDIVATSAEEVKDPQKTMPRGIFLGLGIVTLLYVLVAVVLTGMVSYRDLASSETPNLATAFELVGVDWAAKVIAVGALVGLTTVIMVLLLGLARIVFSMSRDGLLPRGLSKTSAKRGTPVRVQVLAGVVVALIAGLTDVGVLEEMINIGTLSAFVLVSIGVIVLRRTRSDLPRAFRVPLVPFLPILSAVLCIWLMLNLTTLTWARFAVWLVIGVVVYFAYGRRHSRVGREQAAELQEARRP